VYAITYHLGTSLVSLLGTASVQLDGASVGAGAALVSAGSTLSDEVVVEVTPTEIGTSGATVQLAVGGITLNGFGDIAIAELASS